MKGLCADPQGMRVDPQGLRVDPPCAPKRLQCELRELILTDYIKWSLSQNVYSVNHEVCICADMLVYDSP